MRSNPALTSQARQKKGESVGVKSPLQNVIALFVALAHPGALLRTCTERSRSIANWFNAHAFKSQKSKGFNSGLFGCNEMVGLFPPLCTSLLDLFLFHVYLQLNPIMVYWWGKYAPMMLLINKAIGTISEKPLIKGTYYIV